LGQQPAVNGGPWAADPFTPRLAPCRSGLRTGPVPGTPEKGRSRRKRWRCVGEDCRQFWACRPEERGNDLGKWGRARRWAGGASPAVHGAVAFLSGNLLAAAPDGDLPPWFWGRLQIFGGAGYEEEKKQKTCISGNFRLGAEPAAVGAPFWGGAWPEIDGKARSSDLAMPGAARPRASAGLPLTTGSIVRTFGERAFGLTPVRVVAKFGSGTTGGPTEVGAGGHRRRVRGQALAGHRGDSRFTGVF